MDELLEKVRGLPRSTMNCGTEWVRLEQVISALKERGSHSQSAPMSRELDFSNLLRHAFLSGFEKAGKTITEGIGFWPEYDPEQCSAYRRIVSAIFPPAADLPPEEQSLREAIGLGIGGRGVAEF